MKIGMRVLLGAGLLLMAGALVLVGARFFIRYSAAAKQQAAAVSGQADAAQVSPAKASNAKAQPVRFVKNPEQAPSLEFRDISGRVLSAKDLEGKVVILAFWATWCPPCREEIPELVQLQNTYKDRLQVIAVSEDEDPPEKILRFAQQKGMNYPIVMATPKLVADYGGVVALPTTFVIDTHSRIVQKHVGLYPLEAYDRESRALLNMPVDVPVETFVDNGQIFLKNAANATELPGVSLKGLTPGQKKTALYRLNAENCTCGCGLTLAQCRINDTECPISQGIAMKVVDEVAQGKPVPPLPAEPVTKN